MAEYIEREAALVICEKEYQERLKMNDWCGDTVAWNIGHAIKAIPVEDVAPVVRCKDCTHWGGVVFGNVCRRWSAPLAGMRNDTKPDDFCSYGEQKAGDLDK